MKNRKMTPRQIERQANADFFYARIAELKKEGWTAEKALTQTPAPAQPQAMLTCVECGQALHNINCSLNY